MKRLALIGILLLAGCLGSAEPRNPLKRQGEKLWWQADTAAITSNSPWEKFVPKHEARSNDPWANFQEPKLFPDGWVPAKPVPSEKKLLMLELRKTYKELKKVFKKKLDKKQSRTIIPQDESTKVY